MSEGIVFDDMESIGNSMIKTMVVPRNNRAHCAFQIDRIPLLHRKRVPPYKALTFVVKYMERTFVCQVDFGDIQTDHIYPRFFVFSPVRSAFDEGMHNFNR
jgi:hypothetical protein